MVTFELISVDENNAIYWYFPEGERSTHGVISVDIHSKVAEIQALAPSDFTHEISVQELNLLRDSVNQERRLDGRPELTEEEWPAATEPEIVTLYADHAVSKIECTYHAGHLPECGTVIWY